MDDNFTSKARTRKKAGECLYSRHAATYQREQVLVTDDARPRVKCPGCGRILGFLKFTADPSGAITGTFAFHLAAPTSGEYIDPGKPRSAEQLAAMEQYVNGSREINGRVVLKANEVLALLNEIQRWRAWYAANTRSTP